MRSIVFKGDKVTGVSKRVSGWGGGRAIRKYVVPLSYPEDVLYIIKLLSLIVHSVFSVWLLQFFYRYIFTIM